MRWLLDIYRSQFKVTMVTQMQYRVAMGIWLIGGFLLTTSVGAALIPTVLQDLAPARLRARVFASYTVLISAFCAVGPLLSGVISDRLTQGDLMLAMALASDPVCGSVRQKQPSFSPLARAGR